MRERGHVLAVVVSGLAVASMVLSACTMPGNGPIRIPDPPTVATERCGPVPENLQLSIEDSIRVGTIFEVGGPTIDAKGRRYWVSRWVRLDEARLGQWAAIEDEETGRLWIAARASGQHSLATRPDSYEGYSPTPPTDWKVLNHFSHGILFAATPTEEAVSVYWDDEHDYRTRLTGLPTGVTALPDADTVATLAVCTGYRGTVGPFGTDDYWIWDAPWHEMRQQSES